jgi:6-phospho-beta-glucosidase
MSGVELVIIGGAGYERLAARAIPARSRGMAIDALMAHPLVLSYSRSRPLADDHLDAHRLWDQGWSA